MITMLGAFIIIAIIVLALYGFGFFSTPYTDAFRIGFYLLLAIFIVAVVWTGGRNPFEGYDPTPTHP